MRVRVLTRDEMLQLGWMPENNYLRPPPTSAYSDSFGDSQAPYHGELIELTDCRGGERFFGRHIPSSRNFTQDMLKVARVKSREQLLIEGWTEEIGLLRDPDRRHLWTPPTYGEWVSIDGAVETAGVSAFRGIPRGGDGQKNGYYLREFLVDSPIVRLVFGDLPTPVAAPAPWADVPLLTFRTMTVDQLRACGWTQSGDLLEHTDGSRVYTDGQLWGSERTLTRRSWEHAGDWAPVNGGYNLAPIACLTARFKTREQLLAEGWTEDRPSGSREVLRQPNSTSRWYAPPYGRWAPIHGTVYHSRRAGVLATVLVADLNNNPWPRDMFEDCPALRLVFGDTTVVPGAPDEPVEAAPPETNRRVLETIAAFRDAPIEAARSLVTCGFELETQATEGTRADGSGDDEDAEYDEDAWQSAVDERFSSMISSRSTLSRYRREMPAWLAGMSQDRCRLTMEYAGVETLQDLLDKEMIDQDTFDSLHDSIREDAEDQVDRRDYQVERGGCSWIRSNFDIPADVEVGTDGSVSGYEFRTVGALDYQRFTSAADRIFKLDHTIDNGCSFHIHLAIPGVKHRHGNLLQKALTEYLIENIDRVPATVRQRWAAIRSNTYITPGVQKGQKYMFVWKHEQGTWEFRCFGNVQNAEDAKVCLDLAIEAMQYGYMVTTGQVDLFSRRHGFVGDWRTLCFDTLTQGTPISRFLSTRAA